MCRVVVQKQWGVPIIAGRAAGRQGSAPPCRGFLGEPRSRFVLSTPSLSHGVPGGVPGLCRGQARTKNIPCRNPGSSQGASSQKAGTQDPPPCQKRRNDRGTRRKHGCVRRRSFGDVAASCQVVSRRGPDLDSSWGWEAPRRGARARAVGPTREDGGDSHGGWTPAVPHPPA